MNLMMELATIPDTETKSKNKPDDEVFISPEDEAAELRKDLGL